MKGLKKFTGYMRKILFGFWLRLLESLELEWILEEPEQQSKMPEESFISAFE